ncbi:MAG: serine hydrolase [Myxococcota bacterium]|nr:serine hydrolase [Myxococcota bacterium]
MQAVANPWRIKSLTCLLVTAISTAAGAQVHVVQSGEYFGKIARDNGCSVGQLLQVNPKLKNPNRIYPGMKLKLGCKNVKVDPSRTRASRSSARGYKKARLDTKRLEKMMRARGFTPPHRFRALIIEYELNSKGRVISERAFDWKGLSVQAGGWNAASSIKFFAAIAALERLEKWGFPAETWATFHHSKTGKKTNCLIRRKNCTVRELVDDALIESDNIAYDRLVQLAGYDYLNGNLLHPRRGIKGTGLHGPYARSKWIPLSGVRSFRDSPKIQLRHGKKRKTIPAKQYKRGKRGQYHCPWGGTCSTLMDLAEGMKRLLMNRNQIPKREQVRLTQTNRDIISRSMGIYNRKDQRRRGMQFVNALRKAFKDPDVRMFHKPGYAGKWFSDVVYVYLPRSKRRWIVAAAGYPGRRTLTQAGRVMGEIIKNPNAFK